MRPFLTSGMKTSASTEYWSLPNDVQIQIANVSNWGVELVNCADNYPSYLVLYYEMETQGLAILTLLFHHCWIFTLWTCGWHECRLWQLAIHPG